MKLIDDALRWHRRATELAQGLAGAHFWVGVTFSREGHIDGSILSCEEAVSKKPDHIRAPQIPGGAYFILREYEKARDHLRRALLLDPDDEGAKRLSAKAKKQKR